MPVVALATAPLYDVLAGTATAARLACPKVMAAIAFRLMPAALVAGLQSPTSSRSDTRPDTAPLSLVEGSVSAVPATATRGLHAPAPSHLNSGSRRWGPTLMRRTGRLETRPHGEQGGSRWWGWLLVSMRIAGCPKRMLPPKADESVARPCWGCGVRAGTVCGSGHVPHHSHQLVLIQ